MRKNILMAFLIGTLSASAPILSAAAQTEAPKADKAPQIAKTAETKVPPLSVEELDQWLGKINTYTSLYNRSSRVVDSWERYTSWVNVKTGPTGKERIVYGLYNIYDDIAKKLAPAAIEASKSDPKMPTLDKTAADFAAAVTKLAPILTETESYYNRKDYSDDKFARGKELHPKLVEAFNAALETRAAFSTELTVVKNQLDQQLLDHIEKTEGKKYSWHAKRMMMASLKTIELLQGVESKKDFPAFSEAVKSYASIVREFDDYVKDAEDLPIAFTMKDTPSSVLSNLREARDALEKGNMQAFSQSANSAISDYNMMVTFIR